MTEFLLHCADLNLSEILSGHLEEKSSLWILIHISIYICSIHGSWPLDITSMCLWNVCRVIFYTMLGKLLEFPPTKVVPCKSSSYTISESSQIAKNCRHYRHADDLQKTAFCRQCRQFIILALYNDLSSLNANLLHLLNTHIKGFQYNQQNGNQWVLIR